jgi:hypothetical protein
MANKSWMVRRPALASSCWREALKKWMLRGRATVRRIGFALRFQLGVPRRGGDGEPLEQRRMPLRHREPLCRGQLPALLQELQVQREPLVARLQRLDLLGQGRELGYLPGSQVGQLRSLRAHQFAQTPVLFQDFAQP